MITASLWLLLLDHATSGQYNCATESTKYWTSRVDVKVPTQLGLALYPWILMLHYLLLLALG
jgi:hypothetical protein